SPGRAPCLSQLSCGRRFQFFPHEIGAVLNEFLMFGGKGGWEVAIDVELAYNFAMYKYGNHDLGLGFERAGQVSWVFVDIVHNYSLSAGCGCSANALIERDARVR